MERPILKSPPNPYRFREFIQVLEKDIYYARGLHELVRYAHQNCNDEDELDWALTELSKHVRHLSEKEVDNLGHNDPEEVFGCTNNTKITKFYMFDFVRYV